MKLIWRNPLLGYYHLYSFSKGVAMRKKTNQVKLGQRYITYMCQPANSQPTWFFQRHDDSHVKPKTNGVNQNTVLGSFILCRLHHFSNFVYIFSAYMINIILTINIHQLSNVIKKLNLFTIMIKSVFIFNKKKGVSIYINLSPREDYNLLS